jgi:hypothetical protein
MGILDAERIEKLDMEWNLKKKHGRRKLQKKNKRRDRNSSLRVMRILNSSTF